MDERAKAGSTSAPACGTPAFARPGVPAGRLGALLGYVVKHIAHAPIRARGTFGGSIAHADPASEWCLVAATLDAVMNVAIR